MGILTDFYSEVNSLELNATNCLFRLFISLILGVIVGAERKRKGQIAGVRTFSLISVGACLAMLISIYVPQEYLGLKNGDPGRIAAQVITGIGFIGGGTIIHMKGSVKGLTTAAGIWITAIIGMAVGVGMYLCAFGATVLILVVLVVFEWYERWRVVGQASKVLNVVVTGIVQDTSRYRDLFKESGVHLSNYYISYNYKEDHTDINFIVLVPPNEDMITVMHKIAEIYPTESITLSSQIDI